MTDSAPSPDGESVVFEQQTTKPSAVRQAYQNALKPTAFDTLVSRIGTSGFFATLGVLLRPPSPASIQNMSDLPQWYQDNYLRKAKFQAYAHRLFKDTAVLTAFLYIVEGVQQGTRALRGGKDDALNAVLAGAAGGTLWAGAYMPGNRMQRLFSPFLGGASGYVAHGINKAAEAAMLQQQQELERELLGVDADKVQRTLNRDLLRDLIRQKREQLVRQQQAEHQHQQGASSQTQPSTPNVPDWVLRTAGLQPPRSQTSESSMATAHRGGDSTSPSQMRSGMPADGYQQPMADGDNWPTMRDPLMTRDDFTSSPGKAGNDAVSGLGGSRGGNAQPQKQSGDWVGRRASSASAKPEARGGEEIFFREPSDAEWKEDYAG